MRRSSWWARMLAFKIGLLSAFFTGELKAELDEDQLITMRKYREKFSFRTRHWENHGVGLGGAINSSNSSGIIAFYDYSFSSPIKDYSQIHAQLSLISANPSLSGTSAEVSSQQFSLSLIYREVDRSGWFMGSGIKFMQNTLDYIPSAADSQTQSLSESSVELVLDFGFRNYQPYYLNYGIQVSFLSTQEDPSDLDSIPEAEQHRSEVKDIWSASKNTAAIFLGVGYYLADG